MADIHQVPKELAMQIPQREGDGYLVDMSNCPMTRSMLNESSPGFPLNENRRFRINGAAFS